MLSILLSILFLFSNGAFAKETCQDVIDCYDEVADLGEECLEDFPPITFETERDVDVCQLSKKDEECAEALEEYELNQVEEKVKKSNAMANCLENLNETYYCPTISDTRDIVRKKRSEDDDVTVIGVDVFGSEQEEESWKVIPETCKKTENKFEVCDESIDNEEVDCEKMELCNLCYESSDLARELIEVELENMRKTKDCDDELSISRKKRFLKRKRDEKLDIPTSMFQKPFE